MEDIIETNRLCTYDYFTKCICKLKNTFPFLNVNAIGKSVMGKDIYAINMGCGKRKIMVNGAHHANEWITTILLLKFIENYCLAYKNDKIIFGECIESLWRSKTVSIVPLVNPDGVDLVCGGMDKNSEYYKNAKEISSAFPDIPFPDGWKSNIEGCDLNLNYPAGWSKAKKIKYDMGYAKRSPKNYVGDSPLCAPEARAMYNYSVYNSFCLSLSYHTQGKVIYWKYLDFLPEESERIGKELESVSGYNLDITPVESGFAGYKDWFISNYNLPGYTIEAGEGENPLDISQFDEIYSDNEKLIITAIKLA